MPRAEHKATREANLCEVRSVLSIGRELSIVNFVRSSAAEPRVGTIAIVPLDDGGKLFAKLVTSIRDQQHTAENGFEREDETFDHGNASFFPDRAVTWLVDALAAAPFSEVLIVKL